MGKKRPGITARLREAKARKDRAYAATVRDRVIERDGHCRYGKDVASHERSECRGPSEWAHINDWQRFKTRGRPPERRHATQGSMMLCQRHHELYDDGHIEIDYWEPHYCDGHVSYWENGRLMRTNPEWWL